MSSPSLPRTDFQNVTLFNQLFGNKTFTSPRTDIFDTDPKTVTSCLSLITEEYNELVDAISKKDFTETIDALADLIVVIGGMACRFGIDLDKASAIVHNSNMSKLCSSEDEAKKTVEWYLENETRYDSPYYEPALDKTHYVVRNRSTGKILKNINYIPANFKSLLCNEDSHQPCEPVEERKERNDQVEERKEPVSNNIANTANTSTDNTANKVTTSDPIINHEKVREERFQRFKESHLEFIKEHDLNVIVAYNKIMYECRFAIEHYDKTQKEFSVIVSELPESQIFAIFQVQEEFCYLPEFYNMFKYELSSNNGNGNWILKFTKL